MEALISKSHTSMRFSLEFDDWDFPGLWCLGFGIFLVHDSFHQSVIVTGVLLFTSALNSTKSFASICKPWGGGGAPPLPTA